MIAILWFVAVGIVAITMIFLIERASDAYNAWAWRRVVGHGPAVLGRLEPESRFIVRVGDSEVVCDRPDGTREQVTWGELQRVVIVSTSEGPMVPDTFWLLEGETGGCAIPWGATGEGVLLARLQELPGFDNKAVIDAAVDVTDNRRTCWERSTADGGASDPVSA